MVKSGEKWGKMGKNGKKYPENKWGKVGKGGERWGKAAKSDEICS